MKHRLNMSAVVTGSMFRVKANLLSDRRLRLIAVHDAGGSLHAPVLASEGSTNLNEESMP